MSLSQRQTFIASHAPEDVLDRQRLSGSSSPGLDEDEADEVPYSQINSIEEITPQSPVRPAPGGSFPSETKLNALAMYGGSGRHSWAESDVTNELQSGRISREDDVSPVLGSHELDRPYTGGTQESIGDDRDFSTAAIIGAGGAVAATMATRHKGDDVHQYLVQGDVLSSAGPQAAAAYYSSPVINQTEQSQPESTDKRFNRSQPSHSVTVNTGDSRSGDATIGGVFGGVGGREIASRLHSQDHESETGCANITGEGIETKPPVDQDVLPAELNRSTTASTLSGPPLIHSIRRSKSKKEIVEETISEAMGNHPERGVTPGAWPETPASELQQDEVIM